MVDLTWMADMDRSLFPHEHGVPPPSHSNEGGGLELRICPQGHSVPWASWNYAKDDSDGLVDADGVPMYEDGLYCYGCGRAYGISKLRERSL